VKFLGRGGGDAAAPAGEIQALCRTGPATLTVDTTTCVLSVSRGEARLRTVRLTTDAPLTVVSRVPRKDFTVTAEVDAGARAGIAVDGDGGDIRLTCRQDRCTVTLGGED